MNTKILFLIFGVAALTSCSTAYKMGQTPDDVYFSPAREQEEYVEVDNQRNRYSEPERYDSRDDSYEEFGAYRNDRLLRMSIGNRMRLSAFDDYYWNDGYNNWKYNNYANNWNTPWNSYHYWNNWYNPYTRFNYFNPYYGGGNIIVINPNTNIKTPSASVSRPRAFNPGGYTNNNYSNNSLYLDRNAGINSRPTISNTNSRYNNTNRNNNSRFGNTMRKIFTASDDTYYNNNNTQSRSNSNNNTYSSPTKSSSSDAPVRTYSPSNSSSSSGSSSSGSSGGGVSRPTRGGN